MADHAKRLPGNVPGQWYVDEDCIDCDLCRETAPTVFQRHDKNGNSFVYHQPETEEERQLAEEARVSCPVEAIGGDNPSSLEATSSSATELDPCSGTVPPGNADGDGNSCGTVSAFSGRL